MYDETRNITFYEREVDLIADLLVAEYDKLTKQYNKYDSAVSAAVHSRRRIVESCLERMFYGVDAT